MNYCLVIVNGISVINRLRISGLVDWTLVDTLEGPPNADLYVGNFEDTKFLGWSCNIQSQPGARRHIHALKKFIASHSNLDSSGGDGTISGSEEFSDDTPEPKEDNMTDSCKRWPEYLMKMVVRRSPQEGCMVVQGSTSVVSFGDPVRATVATIGFNPASAEFRGNRGLATLDSLGVSSYEEINESHGMNILDGCAEYFGKNPYDRWFLPLDCILRAGARASYYVDARSDARYLDLACHLDLVQWATDPVWGKLEKSTQDRLLESNMPFLRQQLCKGRYRLVIINGSGVKKLIDRFWSMQWNELRHPNVSPSVGLHECQFGNTQILAWSRNIQREPEHIPALARFVAERYAEFQNERRTT